MPRLLLHKIVLGFVVCSIGLLTDPNAAPAGDKSAEASIEAFLDGYFSSWSEGDMDAYKSCFHPEAAIVFLDKANSPRASLPLDAFIRTQEKAHRKSAVKMREVPLDKKIIVSGKTAQATVRWKLFKGDRIVTGVDLFTLVSASGQWKVLYLAFRND